MDVEDLTGENEVAERPPVAAVPARRPITAAHLEPWRGNVIDVTMRDGSHRIGLLEGVDKGMATLRPTGAERADLGPFRVADARRIERGSST